MRVLLVNKFHWPKGGSETYHFALAEGLRASGNDVAFFSMQDERNLPCGQERYFVPASDYNGKSSPVAKAREALAIAYSREALRRFEALCRDFRPDVVHMSLVHRQITLSILDAPYLAENRVPVVWTSHDYIAVCPSYTMLDGEGRVCDACLDSDFSHCVERRCVKGSRAKSALAAHEARSIRRRGLYGKIDRIIAPSGFMRGKLLEGGFPDSQVIHMQNFAKDEVLARARADADATDRERPHLLFFGRLSSEKGVDVLVDAFLSIANRIPGWRLVIAGEGPEREAIKAQLAGHPDGRCVELVGFQRGEALSSLVASASLAISPSRWRENMPYSVVEAFAAGTPVVGTRIGGIPELVSEGGTGFLAEPGDADSLAEAILRGVALCDDLGAYHAIQSRCRAYVLERCDQTRYMEGIVSLYRELIEEKKGAGRESRD
ncbi:glycosyltransferase family 4 protein [Collinsella tanakaei]|nr:glycosyltransferase family 4 protein [Collinsella tanakaei]